jgi:hypothetical protein
MPWFTRDYPLTEQDSQERIMRDYHDDLARVGDQDVMRQMHILRYQQERDSAIVA